MDDSGVWAKVYPDSMVLGNGRNLLYNGAMQVWERGTIATGVVGDGYYTADRWKFATGPGQTSDIEVVDDAPLGFAKSFKWTAVTASGPGGNINQMLEGQDVQHLTDKVTLSFWVKGTMDALPVAFNLNGKGQAPSPSNSNNIIPTGTWTQHSVTFSISGSLPPANNALGASIHFSNATASAGTYVQITGVQLEVGETATSFEHKKYGTELLECQRYYQGPRREFIGSQSANITDMRQTSSLITKMRTPPTVEILDVTENCTANAIHLNSKSVSFEVSAPGTSDFRPTWAWTAEAEL